ncbi:Uncharacterized protein HZ326_17899 [Fusarium oxysporum f. sp. albedinis]|nr:Uncharacterized protein HZ326_17899 [Fusarium oxysporum f. sp. albedinis]
MSGRAAEPSAGGQKHTERGKPEGPSCVCVIMRASAAMVYSWRRFSPSSFASGKASGYGYRHRQTKTTSRS